MEILQLEGGSLETAVTRAADVLSSGGIVLYPTDTLYGLAVEATNVDAVRKLRELKGRNEKKPISIVVADMDMLNRYAELTPSAQALAQEFLPGALTLVLPVKDQSLQELSLDGTIAVRIPENNFCIALAQAFGKPYTATSANKSGEPSEKNVHEILEQFGSDAERIDLVIDNGERADAIPSTIVSCISDTPLILREGAISREELGL